MLDPAHLIQILQQQLTPISQWLEDKSVTELMINPGGHVYIESSGSITYKGQLLSDNAIIMAITAVAKYVGRDAKANSADSIIDASIEDLRIAGALKPTSPDGAFLTIRKHQDKSNRPTLEDLIYKLKALTQKQADQIIELVINQRKNCIIAGATGSGKTTLTNSLLSKIPRHERVITIEDTRELQVTVPNLISLVANPTNNISARSLVKLAMRSRPDRLILGETRGDDTYDLIRAFNSGHDGSISTVHASSAEYALDALEFLFPMSIPEGVFMSTEQIRQYIAKAVNVIVFAGKRTEIINGVPTVVRKIEQICLVNGVINGKYQLTDVV